jgi:Fuc2NAc and GlcNAc transferase
MQIAQPALLGIVSFALSFSLAPFFVKLCNKLNILDKVNHRSSHTETTPRGGGLLIVLIFYVVLGCSLLFSRAPLNAFEYALLLSGLPIAVLGFIDDRFSIKPKIRFTLQLCATAIPLFIYQRHNLNAYGIFSTIILILAWTWFLNLYNFMDGTDGYASMEGITIAIGIMVITSLFFNEMLILIGALLGFLRVNHPKAKLFLGDIGSTFLGYMLGGYLIYAFLQTPSNGMILLSITLLFSFDGTYTLIKRIIKGHKPWEAHREHWYQRLVILGFSHKQVLLWGTLINVFTLIWVTMIIFLFRNKSFEIYLPIFVPYLLTALFVKHLESIQKTQYT